MIKKESLDLIKSTVSIQEFIGNYVQLKKAGTNYVGKCPFHGEKTGSFTIHPDGYYKCFGCGVSGDIFKFVVEHENKTFAEAVKLIAEKYNIPVEEEGVKKEYTAPTPRLEKISAKAIEHFEKRGISNNTLLRFKITEAIEWLPKANAEVRAICFNYYRNDQLVNIKFRGPNKDFKMNKGSELIFYNVDALQNEETVIIVEGEIDCLSMYEAGFYNVVSVPNGASAGNQKLDYLDNCYQYFEDKKKILIMVDNDEPGNKLREELARRLGKNRCWKVEYPADCKDANDILVKHGKAKIEQIVSEAVLWPIEGVLEMADVYPEIIGFFENGYPEGVKSGVEGFDEYLALSEGQLTIVTGTPGSGKSEFIDFIMSSCAKYHQWSWGICSFENQPVSFHATKLAEKITGKSFAFRSNPYSRMSRQELESAIDLMDAHFTFININAIAVTIDGILEKAKELVLRKGIRGLLIDPWNYIEHKIPKGYTETQYISEALTKIKAFCVTSGVHVFMVAHPTKMKKEGNKYEIPTLYHISGSAHFFNKTDNGFCVYRDFETNEVTIFIQKVRFSWSGKVGSVSYSYNIETRQYQYVDK